VCNTMVAFWLIFIGTAGTLERQHLARTAKAAENVMVGNSEKEVLELLGQPNERYEKYPGWTFLGIGSHARQWCYGTRINLKKLIISDVYVMWNPVPINIRWFGYDEDDLIVEWDSNDCVSQLTVPKIEIDKRCDGILAMCYTCHQYSLAISKTIQ